MSSPQSSELPDSAEPLTLGQLLRWGTERLRVASSSPRLDCELLVAHALGIDRSALYSRSGKILDAARCGQVREYLERRADGRPVAQITGRKEFFSLEFEITEAVLAPRPETELLVEVAMDHLESMQPDATCLELGTGCGAVAIALAHQLPACRMLATDISAAALEVAKRNAERLVPERVRFIRGSWFEALDKARRFDAIAANPPYVESHLCRLKPLRFEPRQALDGGADGLRQLRAVISGAPAYLKPGGMLAVEHGADQGNAVRNMMLEAGLTRPAPHRDLARQERVSTAHGNP